MGFRERWQSMEPSRRIQLKRLTCILGIVLLLVMLFFRILAVLFGWGKEVPQPVIRELYNVWILEEGERSVLVYEDGVRVSYEFSEELYPEELYPQGTQLSLREKLADIVLTDGLVTEIRCKEEKIHGKVLAADAEAIELEGYGRVAVSSRARGYKLYGELAMCDIEDLTIGYDFADFVVDNNEICGVLLTKEDAMRYIRVLIKTDGFAEHAHEEVHISADTDYYITGGSYEQPVIQAYEAGEVCIIDRESSLWGETRITIKPAVLTGRIILKNVARGQEMNGYRGTVELLQKDSGIYVINEVTLEEYLYSVVPSEMPATYEPEALKAQAICARTYAYRNMLRAGYPQFGAHVDDSTSYQVYHNIAEQEASTTAVKETHGQVLFAPVYEEASGEQIGEYPAETYYYSTSCGMGASGDVWQIEPTGEPAYLTPKPLNADQAARENPEKAKLLQTESQFATFILQKNMQDYERNLAWYRWKYQVEELDVQGLRERLNARYKATPEKVLMRLEDGSFESREISAFTKVTDIYVSARGLGGVAHELMIVTDEGAYKVITENCIRRVLCDNRYQVVRQDESRQTMGQLLPSGFFIITAKKEYGQVTGYYLTGGGFGHGAGMSQNGANQMAKAGMTASDILGFFYNSCKVQDIYRGGYAES